ncbi:MAG TPA: hypothetical protein DCQ52_16760 [Acidimicrobiaceae bacterium]|nr:hypothetical protein [Acidimicrobiaceae bacterium]
MLPPSARESAMAISTNTATLSPMSVYVTGVSTRDEASLARVATSGRAALAQSRQWDPMLACTRQSPHAGLPQRVQLRPASRSGWR